MAELFEQTFRDNQHRLMGQSLGWLKDLRHKELELLRTQGFPAPKDEAWRYTNLAPLLEQCFTLSLDDTSVRQHFVNGQRLNDAQSHLVVFVNGRYSPSLSSVEQLPVNVLFMSIEEALETHSHLIAPCLTSADEKPSAFSLLNTVLMGDGFFLYVPAATTIDIPFHVLNISTKQTVSAMSHYRNIILAEAGSQMTLFEEYLSVDPVCYFNNIQTHLHVKDDASVDYYKLQNESQHAFHFSHTDIKQSRNSRLNMHRFTFGGALSRDEVDDQFIGEGGSCDLHGLFKVHGYQHCDHYTRINHLVPHCESRECYKGILDGHSEGVFDSKVLVKEGAQKTVAQQTNKNLLLSPDASINTKPELKIYTDDVKCTHGATVGQLDEQAIYYLRSRGLSALEARNLLIDAFGREIIDSIRLDSIQKRTSLFV